MLIESQYNFPVAYIGGTFDASFTLFQLTSLQTFQGVWNPAVTYPATSVVTGSDGNCYVSVSSTTNVNPVTDAGVHWHLATAYDLTGYTASMPVGGAFTLTSGDGLTLGGSAGTIGVQATPAKTSVVPKAQSLHYYLQLTDAGGDVYFPVGGTIAFVSP